MNKQLLTELKSEHNVYKRWKQVQITEGIQRNCLSMQAVVWKDKAHLEFNLGREVRNKKKGFCRSISSKRNTKM